MPLYCYSCPKCGEVAQQHYALRDRRRYIACPSCGTAFAKRDFRAEHGGFRRTTGTWPMESDAAGCHPSQIPEHMQACQEAGVPTEFTPDGQAVFTSRHHRKRFCRAFELYDRNAGYGDAEPIHA